TILLNTRILGDIIAPDQSNVRFTPPLSVHGNKNVACLATNVTSVNQVVKVAIFSTTFSVFPFPVTVTTLLAESLIDPLPPGDVQGFGFFPVPPSNHPQVYCRFIVEGGSRSAIRGSIQIIVPSTLDAGDAFVEASLPAE